MRPFKNNLAQDTRWRRSVRVKRSPVYLLSLTGHLLNMGEKTHRSYLKITSCEYQLELKRAVALKRSLKMSLKK